LRRPAWWARPRERDPSPPARLQRGQQGTRHPRPRRGAPAAPPPRGSPQRFVHGGVHFGFWAVCQDNHLLPPAAAQGAAVAAAGGLRAARGGGGRGGNVRGSGGQGAQGGGERMRGAGPRWGARGRGVVWSSPRLGLGGEARPATGQRARAAAAARARGHAHLRRRRDLPQQRGALAVPVEQQDVVGGPHLRPVRPGGGWAGGRVSARCKSGDERPGPASRRGAARGRGGLRRTALLPHHTASKHSPVKARSRPGQGPVKVKPTG
jgi:hypothetical protein